MDDTARSIPRGRAPSDAFVPVPGCRVCASLEAVAVAAWDGEGIHSLRAWLTATANGMRHRMTVHGLSPGDGREAE